MVNGIEQEVLNTGADKSELEKSLLVGLHGPPELKKEERMHFLGEFRERVIKLLSKAQVMEPAIYLEIAKALDDENASRMLINGEIGLDKVKKYLKLAEEKGIKATLTHDPDFKGDTGLVVVSDQAVDVTDITVEDRTARLKKLGIPSEIIHSAGKKICKRCFNQIVNTDSAEIVNYKKMTLADRFWGEQCPAHKAHRKVK